MSSPAPERTRRELATRWPVLAPLALFGVALLLRIVDIYVLRLGEVLGEIVLSTALGFALVVGYVWWAGRRLSAIGLHSRRLGPALAIGAGLSGLRCHTYGRRAAIVFGIRMPGHRDG